MASRLFSALGKIGIGLAVAGGVVNTALYNGKLKLENFIILKLKVFLCIAFVVHVVSILNFICLLATGVVKCYHVQLMEVIELSYLTGFLAFGKPLLVRALISSFLGFRGLLFLIFDHSHAVCQQLLAARVCIVQIYSLLLVVKQLFAALCL